MVNVLTFFSLGNVTMHVSKFANFFFVLCAQITAFENIPVITFNIGKPAKFVQSFEVFIINECEVSTR